MQSTWWCKPGTALSDHSEGPLQRGKGGARVHRSFYNKHQVVETSKITVCQRKPNISRNSELFYVAFSREDARVWAHWIIPLMYTSAVGGQYPVFSQPESPWGASMQVGCRTDCWMVGTLFPSCVSLGLTVRVAVMWRLEGDNILCLVIWQVSSLTSATAWESLSPNHPARSLLAACSTETVWDHKG